MANTTDCPGTLNCPALPRVSLDQAEMMLKDKLEFISNNLYYPSTGESGSATSAQE